MVLGTIVVILTQSCVSCPAVQVKVKLAGFCQTEFFYYSTFNPEYISYNIEVSAWYKVSHDFIFFVMDNYDCYTVMQHEATN